MNTACLMTTYQPKPNSYVRAHRTRLWDQDNREYMDAAAGVAVTKVAHTHPRILPPNSEQPGHMLHTSNLYTNETH
ncbi:aminotransferase class III-fold pyridoxal phosphate-dependent enzyme, partial [Pseudomonas sp. CCC4.4]|uniref:aminotransferase class III-fold pyridoxal phosphate-dependent enzyme n=1 Tax=Pseudomonas sp. CCC4.4 TaxID=3048612 RepID=UPI002B226E5B